jgi:glyoxylase-like metal-dependent hydrolase (beta-lactamase superfamily II)
MRDGEAALRVRDEPAPVDSRLRYPCGPAPEPGSAVAIRPGVLWLRLPLERPGESVNAWAVRDGPGWTLIDTGLCSEATEAAWFANTAPGGPMGGLPVRRVIGTHLHADHIGMAGSFTRRFDCELWMTRTEYLHARVIETEAGQPTDAGVVEFYRRAGWTEPEIAQYRPGSRNMSILPRSYRRIEDGERLRIGDHDWDVIVGHGHTDEHACLHCPSLGLLISGDQVLPRIDSNVSVQAIEPRADRLQDWLASLAMLQRRVPDTVLVLPSHHDPFAGLHARLDALGSKRHKALAKLRELLAVSPMRAVDAFEPLFGRIGFTDWFRRKLATGEAIAYFNHLIARGEVRADDDAEGVAWYRLVC